MRVISKAFQDALKKDDRTYLTYADITLADGTVLNLTEKEIWADGFTIEDAVSEDNAFTALGSAIIGSATLTIDNTDDTFSEYDFDNAKVRLTLGKKLSNVEKIKLGVYTVDDAQYQSGRITLTMLDNMEQFDRPYSISKLSYPATLNEIVLNACTCCGVSLETLDFPNKTYTVQTRPTDEALTFRDVIRWCATIAGCYARFDGDGNLCFKWFDTEKLKTMYSIAVDYDGGTLADYSTGDELDGGNLTDYTSGGKADGNYNAGQRVPSDVLEGYSSESGVHYFTALYSNTIGVDDVTITGVRVIVKDGDDDRTFAQGAEGYEIEFTDNEFITTATAVDVTEYLASKLVGLSYRRASFSHANDPSVEAGDVAVLRDHKNNIYPILVTSTSFKAYGKQTTVSAADTASEKRATRYCESAKNIVEVKKMLNTEKTLREAQAEELARKLAESSGLYTSSEMTDSGTIFYMHDKPERADSTVLWKMTTEAFGVSTDGGKTWNAGLTVDGDMITRILTASGISADWIRSGSISDNSGKNVWNLANGTFTTSDGTYKIVISNGTLSILKASDNTEIGKIKGMLFNGNTYTNLIADRLRMTGTSNIGMSQSNGSGKTSNFSMSDGQIVISSDGKLVITTADNISISAGQKSITLGSLLNCYSDIQYNGKSIVPTGSGEVKSGYIRFPNQKLQICWGYKEYTATAGSWSAWGNIFECPGNSTTGIAGITWAQEFSTTPVPFVTVYGENFDTWASMYNWGSKTKAPSVFLERGNAPGVQKTLYIYYLGIGYYA